MSSEEGRHFVDSVRLHVKAGDGGHGCISFLREKGKPWGGPNGGDGGRGGSIILVADADMGTLIDVQYRHSIRAQRGQHGGGNQRSGKSGADVEVKVPLGTVVSDADTGEELGDLTQPEQRLVVAQGGWPGRGNQHFATATNKAPHKASDGGPGEERNLLLELKVIADVGLVGLPNAGKSTLLAAMTAAHPKIASYPFTTLHPNLGVFPTSDLKGRITLADIPGLIEGAHEGLGLGHRFLRHIERTRCLVHLVAPEAGVDEDGEMTLADASPETLLYAYNLVRAELEAYSDLLLEKPTLVLLTKIDLLNSEQVEAILEAFREEADVEALPISAADRTGLEELQRRIEELVVAAREVSEKQQARQEAAGRHFEYKEESP